jgi:hypothetical protein
MQRTELGHCALYENFLQRVVLIVCTHIEYMGCGCLAPVRTALPIISGTKKGLVYASIRADYPIELLRPVKRAFLTPLHL